MRNWVIFFYTILLLMFCNFCNNEVKSKKSTLLDNSNVSLLKLENSPQKKIYDTIFEYYQNGEIKSIIPICNGDTSGIVEFFDKDEKITNAIEYSDNLKSGNHEIYYKNEILKQVIFYKIIQGHSVYNGTLYFDTLGNILNDKSDYIGLYIHEDTIKLGEQFNYEIEFRMPREIRGTAYVADFDSDFIVRDSSTFKKLYNNKVYSYLPKHIGQGTLRVKFSLVVDTIENGKLYAKNYFLEAPYFVSMP